MSGISELRNSVVDYLQKDHRLAGIVITGDYPGVRRDNPVRRPAIAIGLDTLDLSGGMGGYLGGTGDMEQYGTVCDITLRIDIFAPIVSAQDMTPHGILEIVLDRLFISKNDFGFYKLWSEGVKWDGTTGALKLSARGSLKAVLGILDDTVAAAEFKIISSI